MSGRSAMQDREMNGLSVGRWYSLGALLGVSVLLSACSTEGFLDSVGMGKNVPDESRVNTVQPLALPPDYRLPPPQEPRQARLSNNLGT